MKKTLTVETQKIEELIELALNSERKRAFHLIRCSNCPEKVPAIICNALLNGTYIAPHKHPKEGSEIWIVVRGELTAVLFDEVGNKTEFHYLSRSANPFIEIPGGIFHTAVVSSDKNLAVIIELYNAVYNPDTYKEFAPWAPSENNSQKKDYLNSLLKGID